MRCLPKTVRTSRVDRLGKRLLMSQEAKRTSVEIMKTTTACFLLVWTASVQAFLPAPPLTAGGRTVDRRILRLHGTIRNDDFSKIFGNQEADERRIRELASEYRPPPKRSSSQDDSNKPSDDTTTKNSVSVGTTTNTTKAVQKPSAGDEQG